MEAFHLPSDAFSGGLFAPERDGLHLDDYDYPLPEALIACYPLPERDESRMLVLNRQTGDISHHRFADLPNFLKAGDCMVLNNTKVLPARFYGNRRGLTGRVEILLLHPEPGASFPETAPSDNGEGTSHTAGLSLRGAERRGNLPADGSEVWSALMRPARKLRGATAGASGTIVEFPGTQATMEVLHVGGRGCCRVRINPAEHGTVPALMNAVGKMPIPPYLRRDAEASDTERYQTVFAKVPGAQAAPTASLHFTPRVLAEIAAGSVKKAEVTLAVSSGTFRTVEVEDIAEHRMDPEFYTIDASAADIVRETRASGGRVLAVGTTVAKTLETAASRHAGAVLPESAWSELFIYPGFEFQAVDMLLTNFHLPKSTLLMLISAFAGRQHVAAAYRAALEAQYRFFSYGDCMLIL